MGNSSCGEWSGGPDLAVVLGSRLHNDDGVADDAERCERGMTLHRWRKPTQAAPDSAPATRVKVAVPIMRPRFDNIARTNLCGTRLHPRGASSANIYL